MSETDICDRCSADPCECELPTSKLPTFKKMSAVNFDLQPGWLRRHEDMSWQWPCRVFVVTVAGERFRLSVDRLAVPAEEAFTYVPEMPTAPATDAEILLLIARAFLGSLPVHPQAELDLEKGWEEMRREILNTEAGGKVTAWSALLPEIREAFAAGVRKAMEGNCSGKPLQSGKLATIPPMEGGAR